MTLPPRDMPLVSAPGPTAPLFVDGIDHPDLWLWDSWTLKKDGALHLYCLALSKSTKTGLRIGPENRNEYPFHIRHFKSEDGGLAWTDQGVFFEPTPEHPFMARNVWSGSMQALPDGRILFGFTGIAEKDSDHNFIQSIGIGLSDGHAVTGLQTTPISCSERDYDDILDAGYYLGPKSELGANSGEAGGPILAWRDPFFVITENSIEAFWAAKIGPAEGCLAHATIQEKDGMFQLKQLHPPIRLPQNDQTTQAEVPKIYGERGDYYLLISASDRLYEGQPDDEVRKMIRLYRSEELRGPWRPYHPEGSDLTENDDLFGISIIDLDLENGQAAFIAPISEKGPEGLHLTMARRLEINLFNKKRERLKL